MRNLKRLVKRRPLYPCIITAVLLACLAGQAAAGTVIINDEFDDGNIKTNTKGPGDGWNKNIYARASQSNFISCTEVGGAAVISIGTEHGSCRLQGKDSDEFKFWNDSGVTVTWVIGETVIQTPHAYNSYNAYHWNLGVISANASNTGWNHIYACKNGGFYMNVAWKKRDDVNVSIRVTNKNCNLKGIEGDMTGCARVGSNRISNPAFPIVVTATLNSNRWSVSINQAMTGSMPLSGNWTTDLSSGELDGTITDEFDNGAFILAMGRNSGIDNQGDFAPNSSRLERITVEISGDKIPPKVTVTSPNGGESWEPGSKQTITWTASDNVKVTSRKNYFNTRKGATWFLLDSAPGNGGVVSQTYSLADIPSIRSGKNGFEIDADYPGGNIIVERIEGDTAYIHQDIRDTKGWWFYWNFRVRGAAGRTLTFRFTNRDPIGLRGPAVSTDAGLTWSWLGRKTVQKTDKGALFTYTFPGDVKEVRFCFSMPYQLSDLQRFLKTHAKNSHLGVRELCKSRKGRSIERLHLGKLQGEPMYRVLLTCRHHSCETTASYCLEGIL